jgi:hypothetical protein
MEHHANSPADLDILTDFLIRAEEDAAARAGDLFDGTPLTTAFADAEWNLIAVLRRLIAEDDQARAFVRRWYTIVETTNADDYPQRRGIAFGRNDSITWTMGAQRLRAAVTLWDAFVHDETVVGYRPLGIEPGLIQH